MSTTLNIAAYKFVPIADAHGLAAAIREAAAALRGTVLLAEEGLNLVLAGEVAAVRGFVAWLRGDTRFTDLAVKESESAAVPFKRLLVKVKREIIRMNLPTVRPAAQRAPALAPRTLARWLEQGHDDDGRALVMLDTRNGFEVDHGAFDGAIDWRLAKFSDFPAALAAHRAELEGKTVISYCTGGIRCEKAALVMQDRGLPNVWQLDGGILKYFEDTEGAPGWRGHLFVFDERVALDTDLQSG